MQKIKRKNYVIMTLKVLCVLGLFWLGGHFLLDVSSNKSAIRGHCQETREFISKNNDTLVQTYTELFPRARDCNGDQVCEKVMSDQLLTPLVGKDEMKYFESTYFVRLNEYGQFEKLFLSGQMKVTKPTTSREKKVVKLLQGKRGEICDEGWKMDGSESTYTIFSSQMRYLYDLYSEAEIIIPVFSDGKVVGAVVRAWGD